MRYFLLFLIPLFLGCNTNKSGVEGNNELNKDALVPQITTVEYAKRFSLEIKGDHYQLNILDPETGKTERSFSINKNKERKIISLTTTLNGMLSLLEAQDFIVGITDRDYLYDLRYIEAVQTGKIAEFGDESTYSIEKIINSGANTILYSGFGDDFPNREKLEKLKFDIIPIYDWRENHPLGKAEWIKVAGILTGNEKEAVAYFNKVVEEYNNTKALVQSVNKKPLVLSGNLIGDIWYTPGGDSYMAKLIADAGGDFIYKDRSGTGSSEFSMEQILEDNQNTAIWLNPGFETKHMIEKMNPHVKHLKAYDNTYCYSPQMNKFWALSAAEPQYMLADLIHIFHPEIKAIDTLYFYSRIH